MSALMSLVATLTATWPAPQAHPQSHTLARRRHLTGYESLAGLFLQLFLMAHYVEASTLLESVVAPVQVSIHQDLKFDQASIYKDAVHDLAVSQPLPTCIRNAVSNMERSCQSAAREASEYDSDVYKKSLATRLAVCELLGTGELSAVPKDCHAFIPFNNVFVDVDSEGWFSYKKTVQDKVYNITGEYYDAFQPDDLTACISALHSIPQAWVSYSNNAEHSAQICERSAHKIEFGKHNPPICHVGSDILLDALIQAAKSIIAKQVKIKNDLSQSHAEWQSILKADHDKFVDLITSQIDLQTRKSTEFQDFVVQLVTTFERDLGSMGNDVVAHLQKNGAQVFAEIKANADNTANDFAAVKASLYTDYVKKVAEHQRAAQVNREAELNHLGNLRDGLNGLMIITDRINSSSVGIGDALRELEQVSYAHVNTAKAMFASAVDISDFLQDSVGSARDLSISLADNVGMGNNLSLALHQASFDLTNVSGTISQISNDLAFYHPGMMASSNHLFSLLIPTAMITYGIMKLTNPRSSAKLAIAGGGYLLLSIYGIRVISAVKHYIDNNTMTIALTMGSLFLILPLLTALTLYMIRRKGQTTTSTLDHSFAEGVDVAPERQESVVPAVPFISKSVNIDIIDLTGDDDEDEEVAVNLDHVKVEREMSWDTLT
ncbi:hypothetical protein MRB53_040556 [Persea americana]|nr:hypothetical protein MRB53_040556 [Persea americana]